MKTYLTDMDVSIIPMEHGVKFHVVDKMVASFSKMYSYDFKVWLADIMYFSVYDMLSSKSRSGAIGKTLRTKKEV